MTREGKCLEQLLSGRKKPLWHQPMTPRLAAACWIQFPFIPLHLLPLQSSAQTSQP